MLSTAVAVGKLVICDRVCVCTLGAKYPSCAVLDILCSVTNLSAVPFVSAPIPLGVAQGGVLSDNTQSGILFKACTNELIPPSILFILDSLSGVFSFCHNVLLYVMLIIFLLLLIMRFVYTSIFICTVSPVPIVIGSIGSE